MRAELDFRTLRDEIEMATRVPDFAVVRRRAGRVRRRDRLTVAGALVGTLAVLAPVAVAAMVGQPATRPALVGPAPEQPTVTSTQPTPMADRPLSMIVKAVAGAMPDGVVAALDVCVDGPPARRCNLQITVLRVGTAVSRPPLLANALRTTPTDRLDDVRLVPTSPSTYLLSAAFNGGGRLSTSVNANGAASALAPTLSFPLTEGDRALQLAEHGRLFGARRSDGEYSVAVKQPDLAQCTLAAAIPPERGWWATGHDPMTRAPAVAVSRDQGRTWAVRALPQVSAGLDVPTVATHDGRFAYAYVRSDTAIRQFRTVDGGHSWTEVPAQIPVQGTLAGRTFGAAVRPDGSALIWLHSSTGLAFLESPTGVAFRPYGGPPGPVFVLDGGFASIGPEPRLSTDGLRWEPAHFSTPKLPE